MNDARVIEIGRLIDESPYSRYQLLVAALCGAIVFMDGFDAQSMGFVAPALAAELGIARTAMGPLLSSGLAGMMFGALGLGLLADRWGRKPVLVASTLIFGFGSLACAAAGSYELLLVCRFVTGVGLGGAMPNTIALTAEYTPKRFRATAVMLMFCGVSLGAATGGFVAAALIEQFGWRSIFVVGGVLPCVAAVVAAALLPESIRFLVLKGARSPEVAARDRKIVAKVVAKIVANAAAKEGTPPVSLANARFEVAEKPASGSQVRELFAQRRAGVTVLLWAIFFMSLLDLYFLNNWLPTIMNEAGIELATAAAITALFQLGGTAGAILLGRRFDRYLSFNVLAVIYAAACVSVVAIGTAGVGLVSLSITIFIAGFCVIGGQVGSNALAAEFYPTAIRSTGVGWALGIGRIGSIIGPFIGGWLLLAVTDVRHVFWAAAIPPLLAAFAALGAARVDARRRARSG